MKLILTLLLLLSVALCVKGQRVKSVLLSNESGSVQMTIKYGRKFKVDSILFTNFKTKFLGKADAGLPNLLGIDNIAFDNNLVLSFNKFIKGADYCGWPNGIQILADLKADSSSRDFCTFGNAHSYQVKKVREYYSEELSDTVYEFKFLNKNWMPIDWAILEVSIARQVGFVGFLLSPKPVRYDAAEFYPSYNRENDVKLYVRKVTY